MLKNVFSKNFCRNQRIELFRAFHFSNVDNIDKSANLDKANVDNEDICPL